jgi:hypothetical protein
MMGGSTVQRVAQVEQILQALQGVGHLKQGSIAVVAQTAKHFLRTGVEVKNLTALAQKIAILFAQHRAATRRQNPLGLLHQLGQHLGFDVSKALLPLALKIFADGAAQTLLDRVIRVQKRDIEPAGELTAHRGFARTWQTNQNQQKMLSQRAGALEWTILGLMNTINSCFLVARKLF